MWDILNNLIELNKFLSASADSQGRKQCLNYSRLKKYPIPRRVLIYLGWAGSSSIWDLNLRICTSTVLGSTNASSLQTASRSCSLLKTFPFLSARNRRSLNSVALSLTGFPFMVSVYLSLSITSSPIFRTFSADGFSNDLLRTALTLATSSLGLKGFVM